MAVNSVCVASVLGKWFWFPLLKSGITSLLPHPFLSPSPLPFLPSPSYPAPPPLLPSSPEPLLPTPLSPPTPLPSSPLLPSPCSPPNPPLLILPSPTSPSPVDIFCTNRIKPLKIPRLYNVFKLLLHFKFLQILLFHQAVNFNCKLRCVQVDSFKFQELMVNKLDSLFKSFL